MFERFTEKAIKVIMLAQEEARRLGHNFVGTELLWIPKSIIYLIKLNFFSDIARINSNFKNSGYPHN